MLGVLLLLIGSGEIALGFLVLKVGYHKISNRLFFIFSLITGIWVISNFLIGITENILWLKMAYALGALIYSMSLIWLLKFLYKDIKNKYLIIIALIALLFAVAALIDGLIIKDVTRLYLGGFEGSFGILFIPFSIFSGIMTVLNLFYAIKGIKINVGLKKQQMKYIAIGYITFGIGALLASFVIPNLGYKESIPLDSVSSLPFLMAISYTIFKHRLMDIRLVVLRTITFSVVVAFISVSVVALTLLLPEILVVNISIKVFIATVVSIFIVLILDPLKKGIAQFTDQLFFKAKVDYQKLLTELSETINREIDLDILLFSMSRTLEKKLKIKNVSIYLSGPVGGAFYKRMGRVDKKGKKVGEEEINKLTEEQKQDIAHRIHHDSTLIEYMRKSKNVVVLEALERKIEDTQDDTARNIMEESMAELDKMDAAVMAPIIVGDSLNAVMVMGPKLSGDPFGSEDLELLQLIGPQLASALEKSHLYEEAQRFTERLKKVEFCGMI